MVLPLQAGTSHSIKLLFVKFTSSCYYWIIVLGGFCAVQRTNLIKILILASGGIEVTDNDTKCR